VKTHLQLKRTKFYINPEISGFLIVAMNYLEIKIAPVTTEIGEILIAELSEMGFYAFEEEDAELKAFIYEKDWDESLFDQIINPHQLLFSISVIEEKNWNELWESNFDPVLVDDFVGVRAHFHEKIENVQHEIVITPKMSFGTGHHATTYSVMLLMKKLVLAGKSVFDFGTGTGILAILAEKLGATSVLAVDNDHWCIENASENILNNNCKYIDLQLIDNSNLNKSFDIIIANINRNIILDNLVYLNKSIKEEGNIILSGLLAEDENDILNAVAVYRWQKVQTVYRNGWIAIWLTKRSTFNNC
jgi:ribosomal protein L11 methyltransferase